MKQTNKLFACLAAATLIPYLLYGFQYFPVLDDFIQYGCYPAYGNLSYVYLTVGTLSTRPLASLLDPLFWGAFWQMPGLALLLVTLLHIASGILFYRTLDRVGLSVTPFFLLIYLLLPLGMEGRYWLSASTRIIVGLFFASLSLYFLSRYISGKKKTGFFILYALFQLISCGFYEPVAIFSALSAVLLFLLNHKRRLFSVPLSAVICLGLMFGYYKIFAGLGALGSRAGHLGFSDLPGKIAEMLRQLGEIGSLMYAGTIKGCMAGLAVLKQNGLWGLIILALILVICLWLGILACRAPAPKVHPLIFVSGGLLLFFAPLAANVLAREVWLTNRSIFVSLIGLALMAEPLFALLRGRVRCIPVFLAAFVCITACVNEYDVYRRVSQQDIRLVDSLAEQLDAASRAGTQEIQVVLRHPVATNQNALYKDHVKSVFDADWSLTGALRARMGSLKPVCSKPVAAKEAFSAWGRQVVYIN